MQFFLEAEQDRLNNCTILSANLLLAAWQGDTFTYFTPLALRKYLNSALQNWGLLSLTS